MADGGSYAAVVAAAQATAVTPNDPAGLPRPLRPQMRPLPPQLQPPRA